RCCMSDTASQVLPAPGLTQAPASTRPRLWPGVVILVLQWLLILVPGWVAPGSRIQFMAMFWGPVAGAAGLALWWLFAGRLRWADRLLGLLTFAAAAGAAYPFCHQSVNWFGLLIYALPRVTTAWVLWLVVTSPLPWQVRRVGLAVVFLLAWGYF